ATSGASSTMPGRYFGLSRRWLIALTVVMLRAHSLVRRPARATVSARAVPQAPPPSTPTDSITPPPQALVAGQAGTRPSPRKDEALGHRGRSHKPSAETVWGARSCCRLAGGGEVGQWPAGPRRRFE